MLRQLHALYLKQQFQPNWLSLFINPFYIIRSRLYKKIKHFAPLCHGKLLDYGCGSKPYKHLFVNCHEYIGVDIENEGHEHSKEQIDVFFDGKKLPFDDHTFDVVFSSEVLEHVFEPDATMLEIKRVLKPNGKVLFVVPFVWDEHEIPNDYGRYTKYGITYFFEKHGFKLINLETDSHFNLVVSQLRICYIRNLLFTRNKYFNMFINIIFIAPFTIAGLLKAAIFPKDYKLYFNTIIFAEKTSCE